MTPASQRRLGRLLCFLFALCMIMGTGPGVLLVNQPRTFLGLPWVYVWGLSWYAAQLTIIVTAYRVLWSRSDINQDGR